MPARSTVHEWVTANREGFADHYARARDVGLDTMADEIFDIVDDNRNDWVERESTRTGQTYIALNDEAIGRARLRFDARRWYLSKLAPKKYGERQAIEHSGPDGRPIQIENDDAAASKLAALLNAIERRAQSEGRDLV